MNDQNKIKIYEELIKEIDAIAYNSREGAAYHEISVDLYESMRQINILIYKKFHTVPVDERIE